VINTIEHAPEKLELSESRVTKLEFGTQKEHEAFAEKVDRFMMSRS
jgi:hypothetical protein